MISVILCRKHALGTMVLRAFLWSRWSHCAIVDGDHVVEAVFWHGVRRRPLADLLAESSKWVRIELPARNPKAVLAAARSQIGKPYDWKGVLGIGFRRRWQDEAAWFCSELPAWAFAEAGEPLFRADAYRITPRDIELPVWR